MLQQLMMTYSPAAVLQLLNMARNWMCALAQKFMSQQGVKTHWPVQSNRCWLSPHSLGVARATSEVEAHVGQLQNPYQGLQLVFLLNLAA